VFGDNIRLLPLGRKTLSGKKGVVDGEGRMFLFQRGGYVIGGIEGEEDERGGGC
jgi:hypothetical protein